MKKNNTGFVYHRETRRRESWWLSRRGATGSGGSTRPRRLVLIDIAVLVVMIAIVVPWAMRRGSTAEVDPYRVRLEKRRRDDGIHLTLTTEYRPSAESTDGTGSAEGDGLLIWEIWDDDQRLLHRETDLLPPAGTDRVFVAHIKPRGIGIESRVRVGGQEIVMRVDDG